MLPAPPQPLPPGFEAHAFDASFEIRVPREQVWEWLETPATFTDGQVWPFRVEFLSREPGEPVGFHEGGLNAHHGPAMSFVGILTEIREGAYRDLRYFYGSYVLSLRWIRPTRLEFWVEDASEGATQVRLRVESQVRRGGAGAWSWLQKRFWGRFPRWMSKSLRGTASELRTA
ncbi:MAG: hypothetical protein AAF430_14250 [Myxococcota bacterium]